MRPKGSKDIKPRKKRKMWTGKEISFIKQNRENMSLNELSLATGRSTGSIAGLCRELKLKKKQSFASLISKRKEVEDLGGISGVYGIVCNKTHKVYIGQSCDCGKRIKNHISHLQCKNHYCKDMVEDFNLYEDSFYFVMFEEVSTQLLEREDYYESRICDHEKYNKLKYVEANQEFMDSIDLTGRYEIVGECWEWKTNFNNDGYGKIKKEINGVKKTFIAHRVSYYKAYGEYPPLIRHLCNNRKCINPEHLSAGSHKENALDKKLTPHILGLS